MAEGQNTYWRSLLYFTSELGCCVKLDAMLFSLLKLLLPFLDRSDGWNKHIKLDWSEGCNKHIKLDWSEDCYKHIKHCLLWQQWSICGLLIHMAAWLKHLRHKQTIYLTSLETSNNITFIYHLGKRQKLRV